MEPRLYCRFCWVCRRRE